VAFEVLEEFDPSVEKISLEIFILHCVGSETEGELVTFYNTGALKSINSHLTNVIIMS